LRILIVKLSAFGDIIHSLPVIDFLQDYGRKNNERIELDWIVEKRWSPLLREHPGIRRLHLTNTLEWRKAVFSRKTRREIFGFISSLRKVKYDMTVDINGLIRSALLARLSRADLSVGFSRDSDICREPQANLLLKKTYSVPHLHVVDQTLHLMARSLNVDQGESREPFLPPIKGAIARAERVIREKGLRPGRFAVVAAGGGWETKLIHEKSTAEICDFIAGYGLTPVLSWAGETEENRSKNIAALMSSEAEQLGNIPVDVFAEILRMSGLVVGPDTGTVHTGSAVKTPTVCYFGPSSENYSGPRRETDRTVQLSPQCGPCFKRVCPKGLCRDLEVEPILEAIAFQLNHASP
jgi:lipopolysaccharide heptosyltransferase I